VYIVSSSSIASPRISCWSRRHELQWAGVSAVSSIQSFEMVWGIQPVKNPAALIPYRYCWTPGGRNSSGNCLTWPLHCVCVSRFILPSLCAVDRNVRIDNLQKHVQDLLTQRETLQFEETRLHQQYAQVGFDSVSMCVWFSGPLCRTDDSMHSLLGGLMLFVMPAVYSMHDQTTLHKWSTFVFDWHQLTSQVPTVAAAVITRYMEDERVLSEHSCTMHSSCTVL